MKTQEHIIAVVEPTRDGEATLDLASEVVDRGGRATLVVLVTRRTLSHIQDFAEAENLTFPDAREIFVERLARTYSSRVGGKETAAILAEGDYSSRTVFDRVTGAHPTVIAMPQALAKRRGWRGSVARSRVPVLIAPPAPA